MLGNYWCYFTLAHVLILFVCLQITTDKVSWTVRNSISHSSEGRILEIKMSAELFSKASPPWLVNGFLMLLCLYALLSVSFHVLNLLFFFFIRHQLYWMRVCSPIYHLILPLEIPYLQIQSHSEKFEVGFKHRNLGRQSSVHNIKQESSASEKSHNLKCFLVRKV